MSNNKKENKYKKLLKVHFNNITISNMNLHDKYTYFEDSKLKESETLLYEIQEKPNKYKRYSRGSIIKVRFGVNIGSEFSGDHYAITISKKDTMMSPVLHVIPLTSKKHKKNIKIGNILYNESEIKKLEDLLKNKLNPNLIKKIKICINYYIKRKNITTYACIDHLKTISKLSIYKNINEFDYLPNIKCSKEIIKKIEEEIIKEYVI